MPIAWLVKYWDKAAKATLPFLKHRKVAVEQVFDKNIIYRRHGDKGLPDKSGWITINSAKQIKDWAKLHVYSFHPHMNGDPSASSGRGRDVWLVMDIDGRMESMFNLTKIAAYEMSKLLDRKKVSHLIKFSGNRGFHILWSLGNITPNWLKLRKIIRGLTSELEKILQQKYSQQFYAKLPKSSPILTNNLADKKASKAILIDDRIIHKNGMIRSPYSIHPKTGLVSLPLNPLAVLKFNKEMALPSKVKIEKVKIPRGSTTPLNLPLD